MVELRGGRKKSRLTRVNRKMDSEGLSNDRIQDREL